MVLSISNTAKDIPNTPKEGKVFWIQCLDRATEIVDVLGPYVDTEKEDTIIIEDILNGFSDRIEEEPVKSRITLLKTLEGINLVCDDGGVLWVNRVDDSAPNLSPTFFQKDQCLIFSTHVRHLPTCLWVDREKDDDPETALQAHLKDKRLDGDGLVRALVNKIHTFFTYDEAKKHLRELLDEVEKQNQRVWRFGPPLTKGAIKVLGCYGESDRELPLNMVLIQRGVTSPDKRKLDMRWDTEN